MATKDVDRVLTREVERKPDLLAADVAKAVGVSEAEVLAWALRGQRVIVVTVDGQKIEGLL